MLFFQEDNEPATNGTLDDDIDLSSADSSPKRITGENILEITKTPPMFNSFDI